MFKNYLLTTWKVLNRRKFFTFISLFGITITLAILLVLSTALDNFLFPSGPEKNNNKFLYVESLSVVSESGESNWTSRPGFLFLKNNVLNLKVPEIISIFTATNATASYIKGEKLSSQLRRTDANYWQILDFDFIEGRAYTQEELDSGAMVAVINESTRRDVFRDNFTLGSKITLNEQIFKVIGVVKDVFVGELHAHSDAWVPYTTLPSTAYQQELMGNWNALLYHSNPKLRDDMQQEYRQQLERNFVTPDPIRFNRAIGGADSSVDRVARQFFGRDDYDSGSSKLISLLLTLVICFMLLPSINLINLNVSRIMERSSEIGVRKAFGASTSQLVTQFVVENIVITAIGGVIGLIISWLILNQIEASGILAGADFHYNWRVFMYGFLLIFTFGLLSGVYPAYKMSKLNPVSALKGGVK